MGPWDEFKRNALDVWEMFWPWLVALVTTGLIIGALYGLNEAYQANPWTFGLAAGAAALVVGVRMLYIKQTDPYGNHILGVF